MIVFQNVSYANHFISSCTRLLGYESDGNSVDNLGSKVIIESFAIGINASNVEMESHDKTTVEQVHAIKEIFKGKKIIVGRDRLDEVRGVMQKLRVFEMFLDMYPQWRGQVGLIQVTSPAQWPSKLMERKVSDLISHINGKYGSLDFTPVQHYHHHLDKDQYFALLRVADVGLITSVRDGMNTMGFEYVICQKESHGPIILSEFTGTANSLKEALHVNPWDTKSVAEIINKCLTMSDEEKRRRELALYTHVTSYTIQAWTRNFIQSLLHALASTELTRQTPSLDTQLLTETYHKSSRRLFILDYDGTLTPIVRNPHEALPSPEIIDYLTTLSADPKNSVWIVSGRDQEFLENWLGHIPGISLSAEHGCFVHYANDEKGQWEDLTKGLNMAWQDEVLRVFKYFTERTQGSTVERKRCALTWHYRRADPEYGAFQAHECQIHLDSLVVKHYDIEILTGKANLEVRPKSVNKGEIVNRLLKEGTYDFVFCAGDDKTDEGTLRSI